MTSSIFTRTSVRKYADRPVEQEKTEYMLKAAMQAPSAGNQQPWEFYVITNKEVLEKLSHISEFSQPAGRAPVAILTVMHATGMPYQNVAPVDMSICTEHLWLACDEMGLGGVWVGVAPFADRIAKVREIMDLPEDLMPFSIFAYGYAEKVRPQKDGFDESRIHYIR